MTDEKKAVKKKLNLPIWARIVLFIISYLILSGIFQAIAAPLANINILDVDAVKNLNSEQLLLMQFVSFLALILLVFIFRKYIDKKSIKSLGFSIEHRLKDIVIGFIIALSIIGGGSLFLYVFNFVEFSNFQINIYSIIISLLLFIIVAFNEEILIRGYILNNLMSSMNKYIALIISTLIFTLFHALNFSFSLLPIINILLAGILLGSTYIFTKNLWFPISLHLFWNFFQGPIMGYSVSGQKTESMFKTTLFGDIRIHGGDFGFEGSIVCTIMLSIAIILIIKYYKTITNEE